MCLYDKLNDLYICDMVIHTKSPLYHVFFFLFHVLLNAFFIRETKEGS